MLLLILVSASLRFWFSLLLRQVVALEDLLVVALVAVDDCCGGLVLLGRGFGISLLGDVVNLKEEEDLWKKMIHLSS